MAETTAPDEQLPEQNTSSSSSSSSSSSAAEETDVQSPKPEAKADDKTKQSRGREEDDKNSSKKQKVDDGKGKDKVEEQSGEEKKKKKKKKKKKEEANKEIPTGPVKLGYKTFDSSVDIFDYFYNFLHSWPLNLNVNKYEHEMLLELLKKGYKHADRKIGVGVRSFQVRMHPTWMARSFFIIRKDESVVDFRLRKCVNRILPLPDEMLPQPGVDRHLRSRRKYAKQGGSRAGGSGM